MGLILFTDHQGVNTLSGKYFYSAYSHGWTVVAGREVGRWFWTFSLTSRYPDPWLVKCSETGESFQ